MKCINCKVTECECHGGNGLGPRPHFCEWARENDPTKDALIRDVSCASGAGGAQNTQRGGGPVLPSPFTMAANFLGTAVKQALHGRPLTDAETAARLAVCSTCENLIIEKGDDWRCGSTDKNRGCGCHLKTAAAWSEKSCPRGLWPSPPLGGKIEKINPPPGPVGPDDA